MTPNNQPFLPGTAKLTIPVERLCLADAVSSLYQPSRTFKLRYIQKLRLNGSNFQLLIGGTSLFLGGRTGKWKHYVILSPLLLGMDLDLLHEMSGYMRVTRPKV